MVHFKSIFGAALLASAVYARPTPQDSAVGNEVGVSAPNGTPITDTIELASQTAAEAAAKTAEEGQASATSPAAESAATAPPAYETLAAYPPASQETTSPVYSPQPTYGSGSAPWNNGQQYNDCVQQCIASHGAPPATWAPTTTAGHGGATPTGTAGATHTIIVAPQQGVLRYVPFAINASVGDVIHFQWNANMHTVTKSSVLLPCNKTEDSPFASGVQNQSFVFTQIVNTTEPTYFHCAVGAHCKNGMFGIINPPNALGAPTSVAGQISNMTQSDPNVAAMVTYTNKKTEGSNAAGWGRSIDLAQMPDWAHQPIVENVMYTRLFLAENPETMGEDGVSLASASATPLKFPEDISTTLNNAGSGAAASPSSGSEASAAPSGETPSSSSSAQNAEPSNGALSMSPSMTLGLFTAVAAIFLL